MNRLDPYNLPPEYDFCIACGAPVTKGTNLCNSKCEQRNKRTKRPKARKKYGLTGYIYDGGHEIKSGVGYE